MEELKKRDLIDAYREVYEAVPQEALELDLRVTIQTIQALAEGQPIPPDRLAELWKMPLKQIRSILDQAVTNGRAEVDDQGNLVGAILSLVPTNHQISMNGKQLYAWCAYDAIYAPGVVGKTAEIFSSDPMTGEAIHALITPDGVSEVQPSDAVVSVLGADADMVGGPNSP